MARLSSNYDARYVASLFYPLITIDDPTLVNNNPQVEIFAASAEKVDRQLTTQGYFQIHSEHLPVVARRVYNNTSCYWMILWNNALIHPLQVTPGTTLNLPNITQVRNALLTQDNNVTRIPTYVVI